MVCMKCGRETEANEVFCPQCQASMEKEAPVKPGTRVSIPKRPVKEAPAPAARQQTPEELIEKLRKRIKALLVLIFVLILCLFVSVGIIVYHQATTEHGGFGIGQNYSTEAPDNVDHGR